MMLKALVFLCGLSAAFAWYGGYGGYGGRKFTTFDFILRQKKQYFQIVIFSVLDFHAL